MSKINYKLIKMSKNVEKLENLIIKIKGDCVNEISIHIAYDTIFLHNAKL